MMLHPSVSQVLDTDTRFLKRILRVSFAIAGCLWIAAYTLHFGSSEVMTTFRLDQYQIYLVLLTLWGYQAKREAKRYRSLFRVATELGKEVTGVTLEEIVQSSSRGDFDVLRRRSKGSWLPVLFSWLLLVLFVLLFMKQMYLLFGTES